MLARSAEALLAGLIDYAGLFPPAALPMAEAVRNYDRYRRGEHAWMLGRFVVPAAQAGEVPAEFPLAVLGVPEGSSVPRGSSAEEFRGTPRNSEERVIFVETTDLSLIPELARRGLRAKIRTGGVTADAFPSAQFIADFIRACRRHGVPFKATAGLHHPLRCVKPLTYEPDAPTGAMHGFVNVFLAAAIPGREEEVLASDGGFSFDDAAARWRDVTVPTEDLAAMRRSFAISFGSCSFEEPIADLKELGWL